MSFGGKGQVGVMAPMPSHSMQPGRNLDLWLPAVGGADRSLARGRCAIHIPLQPAR